MVQLNRKRYRDRFGKLFDKKLSRRLFRQAPRIALNITNELKTVTPVDTGWAASNWIPTIGFQVLQAVGKRPESTGKRQIKDSPESASGIASLLVAMKAAGKSGYRGAPIYIVNNVSYIVDLDNGTSTQEPANFVKRAIARALAKARARGGL